jgi:hypothetical protein
VKRKKLQEQQESPTDMNPLQEQEEPKGNGMEEPKATDAAAFGMCVCARII